ncbi:MAG: glycine zipper 2TM domain-containing protein [Telluria sp.]
MMKRYLSISILAVALGASGLAVAGPSAAAQAQSAPAVCHDCGVVTAVTKKEVKGEGNAKGMIVGGAVGALLGHQVGKGNGRGLATLAGAAGGAYAGKKAQEHMNTHTVWSVEVRYDNGKTAHFTFDKEPGFAKGDRVKKEGATLKRA